MAFTVTAYINFQKKKNSTKTPPSGSSYQTYESVMKDNCSILFPVLSFNFPGGATFNPHQYNYFYIGTFNRYYFTVDWHWSEGLWWAELSVDVMASWKTNIYASYQYVIRSGNSAIIDVSIPDSVYPATFNMSTEHDTVRLYGATNMKGGTYVMGIADGGEFSRGGITYWCGTQNDFSSLFKFLYGTTNWIGGASIDDISNDLLKCLVDPGQYIKSMMWFPFGMNVVSEEGGDAVGAGWWQTDVHLMYTHSTLSVNTSATRHYHPQATSSNSYLNYYPYTTMEVYIPGFGKVPLPPEKFSPGKDIIFDLNVDTVTGTGTLYVHQANLGYAEGIVLKGQVGITVAVTTMVSDILGAASTITNAAANGTNSLAAATIGIVGGVADAAKLLSPDVTVTGGNGNCSEYAVSGLITTRFKKIVSTDGNHMGFPVCASKLLGSTTGYTLVADADIDFPCYDQEKDMIRDYMQGGFYIE